MRWGGCRITLRHGDRNEPGTIGRGLHYCDKLDAVGNTDLKIQGRLTVTVTVIWGIQSRGVSVLPVSMINHVSFLPVQTLVKVFHLYQSHFNRGAKHPQYQWQYSCHPVLSRTHFFYFRDSLTELENFIDSYAADETDEDDDDGEDEQQKMVNLLKQQMMTNLTLMNTLKQKKMSPR